MICFDHVRVVFGEKVLFHDFNLTVNPGAKILLFGPSGTGKTTLLRLILGFSLPEEGSVSYNNREIIGTEAWNVRKQLTYIPQNPDIGDGQVGEVLEGILSLKANQGAKRGNGKLVEYLDSLRLGREILTKDFTALSGGEKQRIAVIAGLLMDRKVFLLDEVTSALDADLKEHIVSLFAGRPDWTVIVVSHDPIWKNRPEFTPVLVGEQG